MATFLFLSIAGFIAAFVDSIAGGGGLISIPAFLIAGINPHYALGTNKFAATTASFTSSVKFARSGKVNFKFIKYIAPFTFVGAVLGVNTVLSIDQKVLYPLVTILILLVGLYTVFSKKLGQDNNFEGISIKNIVKGTIIGFIIGFYDGFFGPGTGSFLIFAFIKIFKYDFVNASGNGKILNFTSNIASLIMFAIKGKIMYTYGIVVAIAMIFGAYFGTKAALKNGARLIKPLFVIMSIGAAIKLIIQYLT